MRFLKIFFQKKFSFVLLPLGSILFVFLFYFVLPDFFIFSEEKNISRISSDENSKKIIKNNNSIHLKPPESQKALYMTGYTAGSKTMRNRLIKMVENTELNSVVIDIKDYTGDIAFSVQDESLKKYGPWKTQKISDIDELIKELHSKGIYVIGRIAVFQDKHLVDKYPEWAVKTSDKKSIWRDRKGIPWLDVGSKDVWDYTVLLSKESYNRGFDEINFDYIRFPSDGDMKNIYFPYSQNKEKSTALESFFKFLSSELKPVGIVTSADLFGMTTTNKDDLMIGQVLEKTLPYFDYVSPMVYPSHYPKTFLGLANPASEPYKVIKYSMTKALMRASTTPWKMRPWIQDFDLGADYDARMVREQIKAVYDSGFTGFMLWDPKNRYTEEALLKE